MLSDLLKEKKAVIVERWLDHILASYPQETSAFLSRSKDRFANPVGHVLRAGAKAVFDDLLDGMDPDKMCRHLDDIIKIRAIQNFSPSQAVSFVFSLKKAVREELGEDAAGPRLSAELAELDAHVDQIALFAFDIYARCREQVHELRANEVKRSVAAVMKRVHGSSPD